MEGQAQRALDPYNLAARVVDPFVVSLSNHAVRPFDKLRTNGGFSSANQRASLPRRTPTTARPE